ncbi:MaoC family dehydratase N-terminal domain-containing protein [Acidisphaera sp. L21]|uniref:FAS1-like dehydratase domain-containing protein n=1 Tax=Acidisphaera sp. L21 TaxID=1641851 RepID=UPI00131D6FB8|nr:MaoC family dehydratase N-terminal domain-containing protein [Acidisphaera sp. L21]
MTILTDEIRGYIGRQSEQITACDAVEPGAVRRYAQAIMADDDMTYAPDATAGRYGGPVAPPIYPAFMFRRPLGTPDVLSERAEDPDFDGLVSSASDGLPELPLHGRALLNGGSEIEFLRYARHGEQVTQRSRYTDIYERESKNGAMLFVIVETEYTAGSDVLLRVRKTIIRR